MIHEIDHEPKTVAEVMSDLKSELEEFVTTRFQMLYSEWSEKWRSFKMTAPALLFGLAVLETACLVLTGFLICIIAQAFAPSPWNYAFSFLLVGVLYAVLGGAVAYMAWGKLKERGVKPERTIRVLQQDRVWLETEGKTQL